MHTFYQSLKCPADLNFNDLVFCVVSDTENLTKKNKLLIDKLCFYNDFEPPSWDNTNDDIEYITSLIMSWYEHNVKATGETIKIFESMRNDVIKGKGLIDD